MSLNLIEIVGVTVAEKRKEPNDKAIKVIRIFFFI
jgi:hypothetical protein